MKTALVTGASRGIGRAIVQRLAKDGFNIAIADLPSQEKEGQTVRRELEQLGVKSIYTSIDVSNKAQVENAINKAHQELQSLDVVVNNAGLCLLESIQELDGEQFNRMWQVNVLGCLYGIQAASKKWQQLGQGRGKIINACSIAGQSGFPIMGGYSATKFAVKSLTQTAARELGPRGITVNSYCPGAVETEMFEHIAQKCFQLGVADSEQEVYDSHIKGAALRRNGSPQDIAKVVSFLASEDSDHMTGQSILIDGGTIFR